MKETSLKIEGGKLVKYNCTLALLISGHLQNLITLIIAYLFSSWPKEAAKLFFSLLHSKFVHVKVQITFYKFKQAWNNPNRFRQ